jgi:hypothetical protein
MTHTDIKGLAVSTSSSEALAAYERGLDLFLRWRGGPMDALGAAVKADPTFVLAHCARALIAWIGLAFARAGEPRKAERQVAYLRSLPEGKASGHWSTVGADILEGELAILRGDDAAAVARMETALGRIHAMGGGSLSRRTSSGTCSSSCTGVSAARER